MGISHYLKEIGRGKDGARALSRAQACDLMGQILDGAISDLELGAFCIAMRVKGETPEELAGFLTAIHERLPKSRSSHLPTVVLPSYNGARKLPVLTPLLALLLARLGIRVVIHGQAHDPGRVTTFEVLRVLQADPSHPIQFPDRLDHLEDTDSVHFLTTDALLPGLQRLLDVRRVVGLRNSAHSLVKLMQPLPGAMLVSSYTHPEYLHSMSQVFQLTRQTAMLLRGTEGEAVADPRRTPQMDLFVNGQSHAIQALQSGPLAHLPQLPIQADSSATANYIRSVLSGQSPIPTPIATQVEHLCTVLALKQTKRSSQEALA